MYVVSKLLDRILVALPPVRIQLGFRGVTGGWAGWALAHLVFARIEVPPGTPNSIHGWFARIENGLCFCY